MDKKVLKALNEAGAVFVRHNKHYIYKLPNGRKVAISGTPSCPYANLKKIADIRRASSL